MDMIERGRSDMPHPGFFIREELGARGWTQRDLAWLLGVDERAVTMIVTGKRGISPEMAKALGDAFTVSPDFFANLQIAYDLFRAREPDHGIARRARLQSTYPVREMQIAYDLFRAREPDHGIARRARLQSTYPVREMIKRGWLQDTDVGLLEIQMCRFFEVDHLDEIPFLNPDEPQERT